MIEDCKLMLDRFDSAPDIGYAAKTDPDLVRHLQNCTACSQELLGRLAVRHRLRTAVSSFSLAPEVARTIQDRPRAVRPSAWMRNVIVLAAVLVLAASAALAYQLGRLRLTPASRESYISSISQRVSAIMQVGLGDHLHCAVFGKIPQDSPTVEALTATLPAQYQDLVGLVKQSLPEGYRVVAAHQCSYRGRNFVHVTASNGWGAISLLITPKAAGESFGNDHRLPTLSQAGIALYSAKVQRFEIAGFETRQHLVYVVSDLGGRKSLDMMAALASGVQGVLLRLEV